ncbi:hypothetical protein BDV23DRAFT_151879 [Aspergillus alliaceus]|uniref:Uncharacterized protein n=1 Tax=Petromyces alliaceus TaxID=209559 RepID=A0A5N7CCW6_PETAA|nr:hypothetical protein BDV23DRAFT_151879 [Aspergillus alliaceus]
MVTGRCDLWLALRDRALIAALVPSLHDLCLAIEGEHRTKPRGGGNILFFFFFIFFLLSLRVCVR